MEDKNNDRLHNNIAHTFTGNYEKHNLNNCNLSVNNINRFNNVNEPVQDINQINNNLSKDYNNKNIEFINTNSNDFINNKYYIHKNINSNDFQNKINDKLNQFESNIISLQNDINHLNNNIYNFITIGKSFINNLLDSVPNNRRSINFPLNNNPNILHNIDVYRLPTYNVKYNTSELKNNLNIYNKQNNEEIYIKNNLDNYNPSLNKYNNISYKEINLNTKNNYILQKTNNIFIEPAFQNIEINNDINNKKINNFNKDNKYISKSTIDFNEYNNNSYINNNNINKAKSNNNINISETKKLNSKKKGPKSKSLKQFEQFKEYMKIFYEKDKLLNLTYKWSLNQIHENSKKLYYRCSDTKCNGRCIVSYKNLQFNNIFNSGDNIQNNLEFELKNKHSLSYYDHIYIRNKIVYLDYKNNTVTKDKLKNYKYRLAFLKEYILDKKILNIKDIKNYFIEKYGDLDYQISDTEKDEILEKYSQKNKINKDEVNIDNIINLDLQIKSAISYINKLYNFKTNNEYNLIDLEYKDEKIVKKIQVSFIKKDKTYIKDIYIIMNNQMINNFKNKNISQYFCDTTYYAVPPGYKDIKLFVILAFDQLEKKTLLLCMSLIKNENYETILEIIKYLKNNYEFNPQIITMDMARGPIKAFLNSFEKINIKICYYHFISRIILHLPQLRSKNKIIKKKAQIILINIKLLCFINFNLIDTFYNKLKTKFSNKTFKKFFNYIDHTYINNNTIIQRFWNHSYNYSNCENDDIYFYTNNICESFN